MSHPRAWNTKDLERRLCHALEVARRTVERLAGTGFTDAADPAEHIRPEKIIAETALLLLAASGAGSGEVQERIRSLTRLLAPYARSERILLGVCLEPAIALDYASAHICLTRLGHPDADFDALLREAVQSQACHGRERVPHRMLEQEWLRSGWAGVAHSRRASASAARSSVLNRPMDLLSGNRDDVYAFTHALMYVTDFNLRPSRLPRSRSAILSDAEMALARCLDEQDYDLGGEVLLTWPLTGRSWSPAAALGFRVLASVEDVAGFLPSAGTRLERLSELEGDRRTDYLLATAYHTAYVMGLLCAAALQPGRRPPCAIPARTSRSGAATPFLEVLDADGPETHWREEVRRLNARERDALAGFFMNIALRRKVTERDFASVAALLREGDRLGLINTPAASQSAELLQRLTLFAEITTQQKTA